MRIYWSRKTTIICLVLMALMLRLSYWQWQRYQQKLGFIAKLDNNLAQPVAPLNSLLDQELHNLLHRRVSIEGSFDYDHEMVLRNRRFEEQPGVFVVTPLHLKDTDKWVLVSRGFIPIKFSTPEQRKQFQTPGPVNLIGLIKASQPRRFLSPSDAPSGPGKPWVDSWLRIDVPSIAKQLPYPVLPVVIESMGAQEESAEQIKEKMVVSKAEREEMLFLPQRSVALPEHALAPERQYPIPVYDTVVPPGRHLGYVYEWIIMAVVTGLIGLVLQLRPSQRA